MSKTITALFKCRNCGAVLAGKEQKLHPTTRWMLEEIFKDNEEYQPIQSCSATGEGMNLLHRCTPERLCVCDFIGWEMKDDG